MEINAQELKKTHELYKLNQWKWQLLDASYDGIDAQKKLHVFVRNPRESEKNYHRRSDLLYGFNFSQSVIDLLSFFLFQQAAHEQFDILDEDQFFQMFLKDADLFGRSFEDWRILAQKKSAIFGFGGVLVDRPLLDGELSRETALAEQVYAFVCLYTPLAILDWKWGVSPTGRPQLQMVKVLGDDGVYRIWTLDEWATFEFIKGKVVQIAGDFNPLGEIPFFWFQNEDLGQRILGRSDIEEISKIDTSVTNNIQQIEQMADYAGFPILLVPDNIEAPGGVELAVGVSSALPFDHEHPDAKPDWMAQQAAEPIDILMKWINEKIRNIYRVSNLTGVTSQTSQTSQVRSAATLEREFQLLNAKLCAKAAQIERLTRQTIRLWGLWQDVDTSGVVIQRSKDFDVQALVDELDIILTAVPFVNSPAFTTASRKRVSRKVIGVADEELIASIDDEIDASEAVDDTNPLPEPIEE